MDLNPVGSKPVTFGMGMGYWSPIKLRAGNIFSRVCLSVHREEGDLDLTVQDPSSRHVETCSLWSVDCRRAGSTH